MRQVLVQVQEKNGYWLTVRALSTPNDTEVLIRMQEVKRSNPTKPVRAIEQKTGALINLLP